MALPRQMLRSFGGESRSPFILSASAMVSVACLVSGCQADITGSGQGRPTGSTNMDPSTNNPSTNNPQTQTPQQVPEPGDWFAAVQAADCKAAQTPPRTRIRRLSNPQWNATVAQALGATPTAQLPADAISSVTGFNTDADLNKVNVLLANAYFDAGDSMAPAAAKALMAQYSCMAASAKDAACNTPLVKDIGSKLFRRPLTDAETTKYSGFLTTQAGLDPAETAVASVIRAMLLSPNMVYLTELGASTPGDNTLTPYEQASLISYTVADVPPDATLLQAAAANKLNDPTERSNQATRLLALPSARAKYSDFWTQYLPTGELRGATGVDPAVLTAMEDETKQHFEKIVWQDNGSFRDLATAPYTYGSQALSAVYGMLSPGSKPGSLSLPMGQRSGFLTQAAFLFMPSTASVPHKVVHRGLVVRRRMLCQSPPPPPANLMPTATDLQPLGADATPAESFAAFQTSKPACAACHNSFQPIGLAFEEFDNVGKFQTTYSSGKTIPTSGELKDAGDASGTYKDAVEIAQRIGNSKIGEYCFSKQYAEYALGRHLNATSDACLIRTASDISANPPVQKLAVVLSDLQASTHRVHN